MGLIVLLLTTVVIITRYVISKVLMLVLISNSLTASWLAMPINVIPII